MPTNTFNQAYNRVRSQFAWVACVFFLINAIVDMIKDDWTNAGVSIAIMIACYAHLRVDMVIKQLTGEKNYIKVDEDNGTLE